MGALDPGASGSVAAEHGPMPRSTSPTAWKGAACPWPETAPPAAVLRPAHGVVTGVQAHGIFWLHGI